MSDFLSIVISVSVVIAAMSATLVPMYILIRQREKKLRLPIDKEQLLRLPGYGLQEELRDKQFAILGYLVLGLYAVLSPFAFTSIKTHINTGTFPYLLSITALGCLIFVAFKTVQNFNQLTKLRLGHAAELAAAGELMLLQAQGYQIFHDIQADKFNIDHLAIGPNGVFAIETKGRHKRTEDSKENHKMAFKDGKLVFPSWTEADPIDQALRQAKWVTQWLSKASGVKITAVPVLVFPGWFINLQSRPPFPILNHKQLATALPRSGNTQLSQEQINAICYQVAQRSVQGPPTK
ncbi:nuclease-related domain-containing protein [Bowmanella pacifica]|uniref:NERD domain-containing protein n=1 Tax=Bowmanella pacifica TaxID=502051 RepID=A0A917YUT5_9ALTE|nr:nuclease-related domain-containing protein [Bowmanella pacifica]GGO66138.1 hypothetical protein GCM10010982_09630 [Bowmanella pacifica]